ncbi:unnamed protein product [Owenia fusiformis]|uniref:Uncharacterized protein n=1 Tax=Owenia fusiformis TaxID=6347 RepID=A0A8J1XTC1_OWEFU|nr:unnamed protein product [Owenia fusiformis]
MGWLHCVLVLGAVWQIKGQVETIGEIYHSASGNSPSNFGSERRIFLLNKLTLKRSVITKIEAYYEREESVTFMVLREHPGKAGDYYVAYSKTAMPTAAMTNQTIEIPSDVEPWHVLSTDRIGFLSSGVAPALKTINVNKAQYMYSSDVDTTISSFKNGVWPWDWMFKVTYDTDVSKFIEGPAVVVPTYAPTTTSTVSKTTNTPGTTTTTTSAGGDNNNNNNNNGGVTGEQTSPWASELLSPIVVIVLLAWCFVITVFLLILCCCVLSRRKSEKKRKFYIDYLRRQNPYIESLRSKDYSWNDLQNGEYGSSGGPEEQKSDVGIVNSMVTNENEPTDSTQPA